MSMVVKPIKRIIGRLNYLIVLFLIFVQALFFSAFTLMNKKIVIFDIDNTIADTVAELLKGSSYKEAWANAKAFTAMRDLAKDYLGNGYKVVYLTARPISQFSVSYKWLKKNEFPVNLLFVTSTPINKRLFFYFSWSNTIVYDDLSYDEEFGDPKFYESEIRFLRFSRKITYYDYAFIKRIVGLKK